MIIIINPSTYLVSTVFQMESISFQTFSISLLPRLLLNVVGISISFLVVFELKLFLYTSQKHVLTSSNTEKIDEKLGV